MNVSIFLAISYPMALDEIEECIPLQHWRYESDNT